MWMEISQITCLRELTPFHENDYGHLETLIPEQLHFHLNENTSISYGRLAQ